MYVGGPTTTKLDGGDGGGGAADGGACGQLATRVGCVTVRGASMEQVQLAYAAIEALAGDGDGGLDGDDCGELADWCQQAGSSQVDAAESDEHSAHTAAAALHRGAYPDTDTQYQPGVSAASAGGGCC